MFDAPSHRYPRKWSEMSLDYKLFFVYHGSMMAMMVAGRSLSTRSTLQVVVVLIGLLTAISISHRQKAGWRWPGIKFPDVLKAAGTLLLILLFLFAATPMFPPVKVLPWYLAGAGIGMLGILTAVKVVDISEAEFALHCRVLDQSGQEIPRASELPERTSPEERWKKVIRGTWTTLFIAIWIVGVLSFYLDGVSFKNGSPVPTATHTEPRTEHGKTVYVTPAEKERTSLLFWTSWVGVAVLIPSGLVLHFFMGIKLFGETPSLPEYLKKKRVSG